MAEIATVADPLRAEREQMRAHARVPRRLTLVVDLPEEPMGNEEGAAVAQHVPLADAVADTGMLGEAVRSLLRTDQH